MGLLTDMQLDAGALGRRIATDPYLRDYQFAPRNLLTPNQASLETSVADWVADTRCALTWSTVVAADGVASLAVTPTSAGNGYFKSAGAVSTYPAVRAGYTYTFSMQVRADAGATPRSVAVSMYWYTAAGVAISETTTGLATATSISAWTTAQVTAVAPATAAYASCRMYFYLAAGAADVHYVDKVGLWEGAGGVWVPGGERLDPGTLGKYWDETVGRRQFAWDTVNNRWQLVYGDTGWRDVSASVINGWTTGGNGLLTRRVGFTVYVQAYWIVGTSATNNTFYTLPSGFRPTVTSLAITGTTAANAFLVCTANSSGCLSSTARDAGDNIAGSWVTNDAWPATLPGTASGTVPFA